MAMSISRLHRGSLFTVKNKLKPILTENLAGAWLFYEGSGTVLYDESKNGNDGTIYGATWGWDTTLKKPFLSYDGADDKVEVPDADILDFASGEALTAVVVFKCLEADIPAVDTVDAALLFKRGNIAIGNNYGYQIWLDKYADGVQVGVATRDTNGTENVVYSGGNYGDGEWHSAWLVRYTDGTIEGYVDGVSVGVDSTVTGDLRNARPLQFGVWVSIRWFKGQMAMAFLWREAKSSSLIENLHYKLLGD